MGLGMQVMLDGRRGRSVTMTLILAVGAAPGKPKLLDQVRDTIRLRHYSLRTEQAYTDWIKRFILFHNKRHPRDMDT